MQLKLNTQQFKAIKSGAKKIEGRTPKDINDRRYEQMKIGDNITFTNNGTGEEITCEVVSASHYKDVRSMFEAENIENILPGTLDIESGIKTYNDIDGYEERIKKFGIYAIGVKLL